MVCAIAVYVSASNSSRRDGRSRVPAQRAELVGRKLLPVRWIVPHASNSLCRLENQAVPTTRRRDVDRRNLIDAPVRSQRVDEAKAKIRHQTINPHPWWTRDNRRPQRRWPFSGRWQVNTRASTISMSCFEFQALNASSGKPVLVQIAIGIARQSVVMLDVAAARHRCRRAHRDCAHT